MEKTININDPNYFQNREISWLLFNKRVLEEANDLRNPLLERLTFLSIFSSNLDEFMMVRVAGLMDQVNAGLTKPENKAGLTPKEQLEEISKLTHDLVGTQYYTYKTLLANLEDEEVCFLSVQDLSDEKKAVLEDYFDRVIFPVLTPMAIDAYRPFPLLANRSVNIAVALYDERKDAEDREKKAIVQIPKGLARFIELPCDENKYEFVLLEDVIVHFIHKLFIGLTVKSVTQFRITRNADLEIHEEGARDLLKEIEEELKTRRWGEPVRLEISKNYKDDEVVGNLIRELEVHEKYVYFIDGPLDLTYLPKFSKKIAPVKEHLVYKRLVPQPPRDLPRDGAGKEQSIFDIALERDILFHHPYESFEPIVDFIRCAAEDPDVLAIKQTLYRVSEQSPIIESLIRAAGNGKQVLVLVELKARFDEEHNVQWARELEKAGCLVIYGKSYLKTHSKITLVVRRVGDDIQRFVHLGTGNYNEQTAKAYTDIGFITAHPEFGNEATNFFNYLSGFMEKPDFQHFSVAPFDIRDRLIELIDEEILFHKQHGNGRIVAKMNSLTDKNIILKLYEASQAGVQIDLIVRGICCLRSGIEGVSENIRVRSIVGRFLEHSRIYYFHHNGDTQIYLSSADLMTRNMENRIEISFPIYNREIQERIIEILQIQLADNVKARVQDSNGDYHYVQKEPNEPEIESQTLLYQFAYQVSDSF
ncbi:polyphosphate kinase [Mesobacillus campisalis]|uniref:Polyphosphate kinase n=1 Tax=Mesobacillus campisalis TaxID=1408103 RepID=A0A0M2T0I7_9BACI|nr:RNA degradosome polyphosphate kinase [Mesobacillus campisalis]KKK39933.1 polyphosphate kinase [Mesobacillus campisalis]